MYCPTFFLFSDLWTLFNQIIDWATRVLPAIPDIKKTTQGQQISSTFSKQIATNYLTICFLLFMIVACQISYSTISSASAVNKSVLFQVGCTCRIHTCVLH